jgi:hypothetical protein
LDWCFASPQDQISELIIQELVIQTHLPHPRKLKVLTAYEMNLEAGFALAVNVEFLLSDCNRCCLSYNLILALVPAP